MLIHHRPFWTLKNDPVNVKEKNQHGLEFRLSLWCVLHPWWWWCFWGAECRLSQYWRIKLSLHIITPSKKCGFPFIWPNMSPQVWRCLAHTFVMFGQCLSVEAISNLILVLSHGPKDSAAVWFNFSSNVQLMCFSTFKLAISSTLAKPVHFTQQLAVN